MVPGDREETAGTLAVAWDTSTLKGVLVVADGGRLLAETRFEASKGHSTWLLPQLDAILRERGLDRGDIRYVAAGTGPGTFTGVKVGVACAKAVAFGLGVPLVGVGTLDVIAESAAAEADAALATIDARRGELYAAAYVRADGELERRTPYLCGTPGEILLAVSALRYRRLALLGEAPTELAGPLRRRGPVMRQDRETPDGSALARLANRKFAGGEAKDPASVNPLYVKKPL